MPSTAAGGSVGRDHYVQVAQGFMFNQSNMNVSHGGRKRIIEGSEEDLLRIERKKIKNRASAARSREKKVERTKFLEEKVEELREENTQLDRLVKLMKMEADEEKEMQAIAAEEAAENLNTLRRTLSAPW